MSIKKLVAQLEKHINAKFSEYKAKFYSNRSKLFIHVGLDKSLFGYEHFRKLLTKIDCFLNKHLRNKFNCVFPTKWIHSSKWKHVYIVSRRNIYSN